MFYQAARSVGISPGEFWSMTLPELLLEFGDKKGGGLSGSQSDELLEWMRNDYGRGGK
jgi:hypothetical protein